jgi:hypothetical protein
MNFLGAPYPITKNPRGFFATQNGVNQVKSDLLALLLTYPGERVMLPLFGTPLNDLIFDPNDTQLSEKARQMIINSIAMWEPRVTIEQIEVTNDFDVNSLDSSDTRQDLPHILGIRILFYDPENIQEIQELKLDVPLGGTS